MSNCPINEYLKIARAPHGLRVDGSWEIINVEVFRHSGPIKSKCCQNHQIRNLDPLPLENNFDTTQKCKSDQKCKMMKISTIWKWQNGWQNYESIKMTHPWNLDPLPLENKFDATPKSQSDQKCKNMKMMRNDDKSIKTTIEITNRSKWPIREI
jgi:hypothetical protein